MKFRNYNFRAAQILQPFHRGTYSDCAPLVSDEQRTGARLWLKNSLGNMRLFKFGDYSTTKAPFERMLLQIGRKQRLATFYFSCAEGNFLLRQAN